ncbi:hypothetical protein F0919_05840 [Taibaiella lutea]|uniref:Uncharacterized protein n=1 Tax=Taibaiella lutea TaxID=2608001 RepID=A0A5M6CPV3_9BACT|nr:hypothetical protein [Taibaiella lutea]KAA5537194.1 hypothetical protein F0919_05840 [Taibaiella lutea]
MSVEEMKALAIKQIEAIEREDELKEVLDYLSHLNENDKQKANLASHYAAIKQEYGDVLKRLAE